MCVAGLSMEGWKRIKIYRLYACGSADLRIRIKKIPIIMLWKSIKDFWVQLSKWVSKFFYQQKQWMCIRTIKLQLKYAKCHGIDKQKCCCLFFVHAQREKRHKQNKWKEEKKNTKSREIPKRIKELLKHTKDKFEQLLAKRYRYGWAHVAHAWLQLTHTIRIR